MSLTPLMVPRAQAIFHPMHFPRWWIGDAQFDRVCQVMTHEVCRGHSWILCTKSDTILARLRSPLRFSKISKCIVTGLKSYCFHLSRYQASHVLPVSFRSRSSGSGIPHWSIRGRDRMVVGFTITYQSVTITTKVVSLNPVHREVYLLQHFVIKFVNDLRQVDGFLRVLRFPPPIKLTTTI